MLVSGSIIWCNKCFGDGTITKFILGTQNGCIQSLLHIGSKLELGIRQWRTHRVPADYDVRSQDRPDDKWETAPFAHCCSARVKSPSAKVISITTTLTGKGEYGRVDDGYVVLRGRFRTMPSPQDQTNFGAMGHLGKYLTSNHYQGTIAQDCKTYLEREFKQQHARHDS